MTTRIRQTSRRALGRRAPRASGLLRASGTAFTLVEMLVCVGAVALIAVGIGKLFSSTSRTLQVGRSVSYMNEVFTMLENRIRRDVGAATRDGPLVIRHKLAGATGGVALSAEDRNPSPRARRLDQIMFLASGKFSSNREPQWPGRSPTSSVARITLGHGQVREAAAATVQPELKDEPNNFGGTGGRAWPPDFGRPNPDGTRGPNQFASDWILLRQVTVLARPQPTITQMPGTVGGHERPTGMTDRNWKDSATQIELQPAAASVFAFDPIHLAEPDRLGFGYEQRPSATPASAQMKRLTAPTTADWLRNGDNQVAWPEVISGLVDVASVDAQMIRTRILGMPARLPWDATFNAAANPRLIVTLPNNLDRAGNYSDYSGANLGNINAAHGAKMLMASMIPGFDPWIFQQGQVASPQNPLTGGTDVLREYRVICAPKPPDFAGTIFGAGTPWPADQPYRQQDQAMLSASNLVVGCSEFRVDWSWGDVYPERDSAGTIAAGPQAATIGQIIWHGRTVTGAAGELGVEPYRASNAHTPRRYDAHTQTYVRQIPPALQAPSTPAEVTVLRTLPSKLIHWPTTAADPMVVPPADPSASSEAPLYSFFGYVDPTYAPQVSNAPATLGVPYGDPDTIDWPWPKLLRFTISLTDPIDATIERTYQFIVEVPAAGGQSQ